MYECDLGMTLTSTAARCERRVAGGAGGVYECDLGMTLTFSTAAGGEHRVAGGDGGVYECDLGITLISTAARCECRVAGGAGGVYDIDLGMTLTFSTAAGGERRVAGGAGGGDRADRGLVAGRAGVRHPAWPAGVGADVAGGATWQAVHQHRARPVHHHVPHPAGESSCSAAQCSVA